MLVYIFFLLGAWKGVLGSDDICQRTRRQVCPKRVGWTFPMNEEELAQLCPRYIQTAECNKDYLEKCDPESVEYQRYLQNLRDVAVDVCKRDSELHSRIVQNIGCFHEVVQEDYKSCRNDLYKKREEMLNHIRQTNAETGYDEKFGEAFECLLASFEIHCYASKSSARCGSEAGDLVLELNRRTGYTSRCSVASEERLAELLALVELELEEEAILNQIMDREQRI